MKTDQKIAVIGCGVMGTILINNLKKLNFNVLGLDINDDTKKAESCNIIVLAVKPQDFKNIALNLNKDTLVISIMAGTSILKIKKQLKISKVVRSMPNMGAKVGVGFTGYYATKEVNAENKKFAKNLFNTMGGSTEVKSEDMINKVTAISGSGPAYVFYMLQSFIDSAKSLGMTEADAKKMVFQTVKGSLALINEKTDLTELIKNVASKGGTTESALKEFAKHKTSHIWKSATSSAYKRAKELSK